MVALRSISVSEVMLRGIGLHQSVNITVPIDDVLEALRTSRLSMGVRMREKYIIKKLTWMLVNVAVSPAARHHEKSGNSRKLSGPSVFGSKHEIT